ncbi:hypothetical protein SBF1_4140020 [Candidatus Desulfosporosinus infrequens]|uniref:Uncharacterized protein n=1 Tax=Candidatus Desulfosporosinus infrequens TaxID=2043169 RepID=A0A2U3L941_9FIRM|nr:hypothetical protein SBF1_4140020 [Candidatus Desulfosporosinus infrequens]
MANKNPLALYNGKIEEIQSGDVVNPARLPFSAALPAMDGTATAGIATTIPCSDHVHPSDTTRASITLALALSIALGG